MHLLKRRTRRRVLHHLKDPVLGHLGGILQLCRGQKQLFFICILIKNIAEQEVVLFLMLDLFYILRSRNLIFRNLI